MIHLRTPAEIEKMRLCGRIVAETLQLLGREIRPGVTTKQLERLAVQYIRSQGAVAAFKGYHGYPGYICTSIDAEVVHGIPSERRVLQEGDIIGIDIGVRLDGYLGDAAYTFAVGKVSPEKQRLMEVTAEALRLGIEQAVAGNYLSDIGHAIQSYVESQGMGVVRQLVGHGIGRELHEAPEVPNYGEPKKGPLLREGMCLAIEPMVTLGTYDIEVLSDGWTVVTCDRQPSAHYEHTIAITADGPRILTQV